MNTSQNFVNVIEEFESGWVSTLRKAIDTFIVLISEGSQADREEFIKQFLSIYDAKYKKTQEAKRGGAMQQVSAGGTLLLIDMSKDSANAVLDIPPSEGLRNELYSQTFKVMGDEWGRRYATNLIRRDELIDLMRRIRPVMKESGNERKYLSIIQDAFVDQYKSDGTNVFRIILVDAGYDTSSSSNSGNSGKKK
jgi:hypothetical protein